jgi:hypothetical protein
VTPQTRLRATSRGRKTPLVEMSSVMTEITEEAHVLDDEVLVRGQKIAEHVAEDAFHRRGVEDRALDGPRHHDEGEERQDGVGGDAEGVGVHLALRKVAREGDELRPPSGVRRQARWWLGDGVGGRGWLDGQHGPDSMLRHVTRRCLAGPIWLP